MPTRYTFLLMSLWGAMLLVPSAARGQQVGEVERMVQGRAQRVQTTTDAEIQRPASGSIQPVQEREGLLVADTLVLRNQLWMELKIERPGLQGHVILAEEGVYSIDALAPDNTVLFRLRQGRMSVNLKRGELGIRLKNTLVSIFGTEMFLQADSSTNRAYLKQGRIQFDIPGQDSIYVEGKEIAWLWQHGETPQRMEGDAFDRWKRRMMYDTRTVWRKPFFKRTWVHLGMAALAGGAVYYVLRRLDDGARTTQNDFLTTTR